MPLPSPASIELARIQTFRSLATLDTSSDPTIHALLKVAALGMRCTKAAVCLIDGDRHWVKASYGMDSVPERCGVAFATRVAACDDVLVLTDAEFEPLAGEHRDGLAPDPTRLFLGAPVRVDGHTVGVLCLFGPERRQLDDNDRAMLLELRATVEHWLHALRERLKSEARAREFRELADQMPGIVYRAVMDEASSTLYVSSRVRELGYTPEEWIARPEAWMEALHPEDRSRVLVELATGLKTQQSFELQYRIRNGAGAWRHYHDAVRIVHPTDGDSEPLIQGLMTDVTEQVERGLAHDQLFAQLPDGVLILDAGHHILDANPQAERLLGLGRAQLLQRHIGSLFSNDEPAQQAEDALRALSSEANVLEWDYWHPNGQLRSLEDTTRTLDDGRQIRLLRDTTERREETGWLRKLSMAAEQASEAIVITDIEANIEYVNRAMVRASGYSREELLGQNSRILQSGMTPRSRYRKLWEALTAGKPWRGFLNNRRKDGSHYVEFAVITPVRGPDGRITNYLAVKEDITEKRRMSEDLDRYRHHLDELVNQRTVELENARHSAEAASAAKSAFLATMSHEIRTPMNGVMGVADVLLQSPLSPQQQELVETINESAAALLAIIDDILDFSKIEAGRLVLEQAPFAIRSVVGRSCAPLSTLAVGRGVHLHAFAHPHLPDLMIGDGTRVRQILLNLVGNAIKFSAGLNRPGRVVVRATPEGDGVRLTVTDNGIGMSDDVQRQVFQPFVQGEASTTRNYGGTGLGLAITQRLVSAMGGTIGVQSRPGEGSTFTVDLPLKPVSGVSSAVSSELVGIHCLLQHSDPDAQADWATYLESAGARVSLLNSAPGGGIWTDHAGETRVLIRSAGSPPLVSAVADTAGAPTGVVVVHQAPRHEPVSQASGQVRISGIGLRRKDLLVAVAMAAGRVLVPDHGVVSTDRDRPQTDWKRVEACQGRAILVAEDNEINQRVFRYQLELLGLEHVFAADGREALALWREAPERFCLLLTDLQMPGLSGIGLTERIRKEEAVGQRMPIIALTANAMHSEVLRCRLAGMDDYLTKPVSLPKLENVLLKWLEVARAPAPPVAMPPSFDAPAAAAPAPVLAEHEFDSEALARVLGRDPEILQDMRSRYLASLERALIEINEAVARQDGSAAGFTAHRIKSSSRIVGAVGLARLLEQIEALGRSNDSQGIAGLVPRLDAAIAAVHKDFLRQEHAVRPAPLTHVLCIDDDPVHLEELVRLLARTGAPRVESFTDPDRLQQRLDELDTSQVLLMLDLHMPAMNGVELIQNLSQRRFEGHVALIGRFDHQMLDTAERLVEGYSLKWAGTLSGSVSESQVLQILQACCGPQD